MSARLLLAEQIDAELALNGAVLEAVPDALLDWTPHPASFSIGRLAMHVAAIPGWMPAFTGRRTYDMGAGGPGPAIPSSRSEIFETSTQASEAARAAVPATYGDSADCRLLPPPQADAEPGDALGAGRHE